MSLMWVVPGYIVNTALEVYLLISYWDLYDPTVVCLLVDIVHYAIVFCLLVALWYIYQYESANVRLQWIEIFPTFAYIGAIFVVVLQDMNKENIIATVNFSIAFLRYFLIVIGARKKKRFIAISESGSTLIT